MIRRAIAVLALAAGILVGGAGSPAEAGDTRMGVYQNTYVNCTHTPTVIIRPTGTLRSYCTFYAYRYTWVRNPGGSCDRYLIYGEAWKYTTHLSFVETLPRVHIGWYPSC